MKKRMIYALFGALVFVVGIAAGCEGAETVSEETVVTVEDALSGGNEFGAEGTFVEKDSVEVGLSGANESVGDSADAGSSGKKAEVNVAEKEEAAGGNGSVIKSAEAGGPGNKAVVNGTGKEQAGSGMGSVKDIVGKNADLGAGTMKASGSDAVKNKAAGSASNLSGRVPNSTLIPGVNAPELPKAEAASSKNPVGVSDGTGSDRNGNKSVSQPVPEEACDRIMYGAFFGTGEIQLIYESAGEGAAPVKEPNGSKAYLSGAQQVHVLATTANGWCRIDKASSLGPVFTQRIVGYVPQSALITAMEREEIISASREASKAAEEELANSDQPADPDEADKSDQPANSDENDQSEESVNEEEPANPGQSDDEVTVITPVQETAGNEVVLPKETSWQQQTG